MSKTVVFVTNQYSCDRLIHAARMLADETGNELIVASVLNSEYDLDPAIVDYLFRLSKNNKAAMRLLLTEDKLIAMREAIDSQECTSVVTGMPYNQHSVLYTLWKEFPRIAFYTADVTGELLKVGKNQYCPA